MESSNNNQNTTMALEHRDTFDLVSDFEAIQICFERVANLIQLYREMIEHEWGTSVKTEPYMIELLLKRRELHFSSFEAIEILFNSTLGEMAEAVNKGYRYCNQIKPVQEKTELQM